MEKQCKKCGEIKPIEQFSTNGLLPNGDKHKRDFFEMVLNKDLNGKKINLKEATNDFPF